MRKIILLPVFNLIILMTNAQLQSHELGISAHLVKIKSNAENNIRIVLKDTMKNDRNTVNAFANAYNEIKISADEFIYQLCTDINNRNRVLLFKRIQRKIIKNGLVESGCGKVKKYTRKMSEINILYTKFKNESDDFINKFSQERFDVATNGSKKNNKGDSTVATLTELFPPMELISAGVDITASIMEINAGKTERLSALLLNLSFSPISKLGEEEKEEEEKK